MGLLCGQRKGKAWLIHCRELGLEDQLFEPGPLHTLFHVIHPVALFMATYVFSSWFRNNGLVLGCAAANHCQLRGRVWILLLHPQEGRKIDLLR